MKLVVPLLFLFTLQMNATTYGQETRVSVNLEKATFRETARALKAETGYTFLYRDQQVEALRPFSIRCHDMELREVLEACLKDSDLTFKVVDQTIVIMPRGDAGLPLAQPRQVKVTGSVVDAQGNPVAGATILLKGSTIGTSTRADGTFELTIPAVSDPVLVVRFIGMKSREMPATSDKPLAITLEEEITEIADVVVTGIFVKAKESYTGAVTTITASELKASGNRGILSSIRNIDPSFNIID
ncbi:MAG: carboxypeptidase-like regulatory domain-containing protein, partial [Odoribacteraceae bacterium]|nr:carboxypeptidase-like regulatory domain-containing protein [Odoribacteraceae bacterium]